MVLATRMTTDIIEFMLKIFYKKKMGTDNILVN